MSPAYPYRFDRTSSISEVVARHAELAPGDETTDRVALAGRITTVRTHGKIAFADLKDSSDTIQLFGRQDVLGDVGMAAFGELGVGDIVGAEGEIVRTKRGELSLKVSSVAVLAPCLRPMPDSWHGLSDVEVRYRQRYLDLLINPDPRRAITARAAANAAIRTFLDERGFIEVETPLLHPVAGGAVARPFVTHNNALDMDLFLRVAPELYLKRLLIGGYERVYELNRSFRNEGISTQHNPEFTMLEAYEAYVDWHDTMDLVEGLVRAIVKAVTGTATLESADGAALDIEAPFERVTMFEAIATHTGIDLNDVWASEDAGALTDQARSLGVTIDPKWDRGKTMLEIFEATTEKKLRTPTFVMGFPKEVSPLAKDNRQIPGFTEHADLVIGGIEIAPLYSELNDPEEQRRRFEQQAGVHEQGTEEIARGDAEFVEALAYGMPPAGGFGLGLDRLLALALGLGSLREVIMFPTLRPEA